MNTWTSPALTELYHRVHAPVNRVEKQAFLLILIDGRKDPDFDSSQKKNERESP